MGILIGSMTLEDPVILAPMSGVSDLPFRRLVKRLGAGLVVSEMIASEAMIRETRQSMTMARSCADEQPMAVQLAGCEPRVMADAARLNADRGARIIDINFGCPVKKVVNGHSGSALMRDETHAARILEATVRAVDLPVSLMMGRGCYGRPWFSRQVAGWIGSRARIPDPPPSVQLEIVLSHYEDMLTHYGNAVGTHIARKHIGWYSKGFPGAAEFRATINRTIDTAHVRQLIRTFYEPLGYEPLAARQAA